MSTTIDGSTNLRRSCLRDDLVRRWKQDKLSWRLGYCHGPISRTSDPNIVSMWDDMYDCWVRELGLEPDVYDEAKGGYQDDYSPSFEDHIEPIFRSAALQHWTTNLSERGISAHRQLVAITAADDPSTTALAGLVAVFRNPFKPDQLGDP